MPENSPARFDDRDAPLSRRRVLEGMAGVGAAVLGAGLPATRPAEAGAALAASYPDLLKFAVSREGSPLGVAMVRFERDGGDAVTKVCIDFSVEFAGITVYRYEHRARERGRGGRLFALDTVTHDDGVPQAVTARDEGDGLRVDGMQGTLLAPADIIPSSYWHPRFVDQTRMLDSQLGRLLEFSIEEVGRETVTALGTSSDCIRYAMRGDIDLDIWYDARRVWQKMTFTIGGGFIEYTRFAPDPADAGRFALPVRDGRALPAT